MTLGEAKNARKIVTLVRFLLEAEIQKSWKYFY